MSESRKLRALIFLNAMMIVGMSTSIFTAQVKLSLPFFGHLLIFPASNLFFSFLTFPVTDVITDIFGAKEANRTVWLGFWSQFLTLVIIQICLFFSGGDSPLAPFAMGGVRVFFASTLAYFLSQFWDVWAFAWIKKNITGEKHLWLRNNLATSTSQLINSTLFITIVFGVDLLPVMLSSSMIVKCMLAALDTPCVYLGCYLLRKTERQEVPSFER